MPLYELGKESFVKLDRTTFGGEKILERDVQRLLRMQIEVISEDLLVIAEEFNDWDGSQRRIDLLAIDRNANLIVIELKRDESGRHMELQAIRYAAMISAMTFEQAKDAFEKFLISTDRADIDAEGEILGFLGWDEPSEEDFGQNVKIILVSADFSTELTSSVLWLSSQDIDIRCIKMEPYKLENKLVVKTDQIVPLPETSELQVKIKDKNRVVRRARAGKADYTKYDVTFADETQSKIAKNRAVLFLVTHLAANGVEPLVIEGLGGWPLSQTWLSFDGKLTQEEFATQSREYYKSKNSKDTKGGAVRWFMKEGELITVNGKTFAFSSQWEKRTCESALKLLKETYVQFNIDYSPSVEQ